MGFGGSMCRYLSGKKSSFYIFCSSEVFGELLRNSEDRNLEVSTESKEVIKHLIFKNEPKLRSRICKSLFKFFDEYLDRIDSG